MAIRTSLRKSFYFKWNWNSANKEFTSRSEIKLCQVYYSIAWFVSNFSRLFLFWYRGAFEYTCFVPVPFCLSFVMWLFKYRFMNRQNYWNSAWIIYGLQCVCKKNVATCFVSIYTKDRSAGNYYELKYIPYIYTYLFIWCSFHWVHWSNLMTFGAKPLNLTMLAQIVASSRLIFYLDIKSQSAASFCWNWNLCSLFCSLFGQLISLTTFLFVQLSVNISMFSFANSDWFLSDVLYIIFATIFAWFIQFTFLSGFALIKVFLCLLYWLRC